MRQAVIGAFAAAAITIFGSSAASAGGCCGPVRWGCGCGVNVIYGTPVYQQPVYIVRQGPVFYDPSVPYQGPEYVVPGGPVYYPYVPPYGYYGHRHWRHRGYWRSGYYGHRHWFRHNRRGDYRFHSWPGHRMHRFHRVSSRSGWRYRNVYRFNVRMHRGYGPHRHR